MHLQCFVNPHCRQLIVRVKIYSQDASGMAIRSCEQAACAAVPDLCGSIGAGRRDFVIVDIKIDAVNSRLVIERFFT